MCRRHEKGTRGKEVGGKRIDSRAEGGSPLQLPRKTPPRVRPEKLLCLTNHSRLNEEYKFTLPRFLRFLFDLPFSHPARESSFPLLSFFFLTSFAKNAENRKIFIFIKRYTHIYVYISNGGVLINFCGIRRSTFNTSTMTKSFLSKSAPNSLFEYPYSSHRKVSNYVGLY